MKKTLLLLLNLSKTKIKVRQAGPNQFLRRKQALLKKKRRKLRLISIFFKE
jgi:hypothetical protein